MLIAKSHGSIKNKYKSISLFIINFKATDFMIGIFFYLNCQGLIYGYIFSQFPLIKIW